MCSRAGHMELSGQQGMKWSALLGKHGMLGGIYLTVGSSGERNGRAGLGLTLSTQHACDVLEPCQGEVSALAQILFGQLGTRCQVGRPVAVTTLFGFLACGIVAALAGEGKGGYLIEPGKPGGAVRGNPELLAVTGLVEFVDLGRGRPGQRMESVLARRWPISPRRISSAQPSSPACCTRTPGTSARAPRRAFWPARPTL